MAQSSYMCHSIIVNTSSEESFLIVINQIKQLNSKSDTSFGKLENYA